ncbi:DMT family transporter [Tissierellaceae bacterium HCP3S3_D8]
MERVDSTRTTITEDKKVRGNIINPRIKIIIAMLIWGTIGLFVRGIELGSIEIAFFRAVIGSGFLLIISLLKKDKVDKDLLKANILILSISGLLLGLNWITLFQAMKYTTISNAVLSYYFAPVFIVLLSSIVLKEKMNLKSIICLLGAVAGLFLILKSGNEESIQAYDHIKGVSYGLAGAVVYAIIVLFNKYIKGLSGFQATMIQLSIATLVLIPMVLSQGTINFGAINIKTWILILVLGVVHTGIAYLLYFTSIKDVKSQTIAILSYLDPIFAIFISFLFLGESMGISQILGGILILSTAYISEK